MFQINDTVSYGTQGVCTVIGIEKLALYSSPEEYYILQPVYQTGSKIYVPVGNKTLTDKMRRILSKDEIRELIRVMPDGDTIWIENDAERKEKYQQIIASGDRRKIAQLIKTLYLQQSERQKNGKRLRQSDEILFKRAETLLYNEFALVLDIKHDQVVPFLHEQIGFEAVDRKQ